MRNAFTQVADAIDDGDLQDAQNAFDSLAQLLNPNQQSSQNATSSGSSTQTSANGTDVSSLISQIGSALQSGDLDQAKQALQSLQQTVCSRRVSITTTVIMAAGAAASPPLSPLRAPALRPRPLPMPAASVASI